LVLLVMQKRSGHFGGRDSFGERVLAVLLKIPRGRVITYRDIARLAGSPRAYRAAGNALNKNPRPIRVPCHRVVASDGAIGGYAKGARLKAKLLTREGVLIKKGRIDLSRYRVRI
jgi:methylated-DNA-[protein]-cysteine S-methyltransferase